MTESPELFLKYLGPQISLKNGSVLKTNLWMSGFKWDWPQPWGLFIFGEKKTVTIMQSFKVFLKDCTVVFACFFQKSEPSMVRVCLIWDLISKGPFWVLNHFWGIFLGRDIWKATLNFWSMINFQCIFIYLVHNWTATLKILTWYM